MHKNTKQVHALKHSVNKVLEKHKTSKDLSHRKIIPAHNQLRFFTGKSTVN